MCVTARHCSGGRRCSLSAHPALVPSVHALTWNIITLQLFSGFVGMFSKAVVSVFSSSVSGDVGANLGRWEVWIFLLLLPTALGCQVTFLNSALKRFDAKEAVPLYQSMVVVCGVVFGWTIFNESAGKSGTFVCTSRLRVCVEATPEKCTTPEHRGGAHFNRSTAMTLVARTDFPVHESPVVPSFQAHLRGSYRYRTSLLLCGHKCILLQAAQLRASSAASCLLWWESYACC